MSIFVSATAPPNAASPEVFRAYGCTTDVAVKPTDVSIYGTPAAPNMHYDLFVRRIEYFAASLFLGRDINCKTDTSKGGYIDITQAPFNILLSPPPIGVSFSNQLSPDASETMNNLGFSREVSGRLTYYRGTIRPEDLKSLPNGAKFNTFTPTGLTNIHGLLAWRMSNRLLFAAIASFKKEAMDVELSLRLLGLGSSSSALPSAIGLEEQALPAAENESEVDMEE